MRLDHLLSKEPRFWGGHRVDGVPGPGWPLPALFPRVGVGVVGWGWVSFHLIPHRITYLAGSGLSAAFVAAVVGVGGWVWVWLGGTLLLLVTVACTAALWGGWCGWARTRCWVLRRHLWG